MSKIVLSARHRVAVRAALASLTVFVAPIQTARGQTRPSTPVTVENPATSPVPTTVLNPATSPVPATVLNPATMPALTSSVDDPGRVAYQNTQSLSRGGVTRCSFKYLRQVIPDSAKVCGPACKWIDRRIPPQRETGATPSAHQTQSHSFRHLNVEPLHNAPIMGNHRLQQRLPPWSASASSFGARHACRS